MATYTKLANLKGPKGDKGDTGTFAAASAESVGAGESAEVVMSGPETARAVHFKVPRGPQGLPGMNSAPTDAAFAQLVSTPGTETQTQVDAHITAAIGGGRIVRVMEGAPLPPLLDGDLVVRYAVVHLIDFADDTIGAAPDGWSPIWAAGDWQVVDDPIASHGKSLRVTATENARRGLSFDAVETDPLRGDAEIVFKWRSTAFPPRVFIRGSGDTGAESAYYGTTNSHSASRLAKYVEGAVTQLGTADSISLPLGQWNISRMRVEGNTLKGKSWDASQPEPSAWDSEVTGNSISGVGSVGLLHGLTGNAVIDWVGIATGGNPAPRGQ